MTNVEARPELPLEADELQVTIKRIGLARFVGRINSGVIPLDEGYAAVQRFVAHEKKRPLLSKLTHTVFSRSDSYSNHHRAR